MLVHGDELCTDDKEHQVFRKLVQTTSWKDQFKSKPIYERKKIAEQLRTKSEEGKLKKTMEIMDVNLDAIDRLLKKNNSHFLIHGHTHRPGKNILPSGNLNLSPSSS